MEGLTRGAAQREQLRAAELGSATVMWLKIKNDRLFGITFGILEVTTEWEQYCQIYDIYYIIGAFNLYLSLGYVAIKRFKKHIWIKNITFQSKALKVHNALRVRTTDFHMIQ